MSEGRVDAITRSAAGALSRRSSLRTLGTAALAAGLAKVAGIEAKQNPVKKVKEKNKRRCGQVREACRAIPLAVPHPDDVSGLVLTCCEHCFVGDFLECFTAGLNAASVDDTLLHGLSQAGA